MTLEARLLEVLANLTGGRVYPDTAPDNATFPLITYQQVGGGNYAYANGTLPDKEHARLQINVHSHVRSEAKAIALQVEERMAGVLLAQVYGSLTTGFDDTAKLYTTRQDFGCRYPR